MHKLAAGQETQKSWPAGITGFGLGVTDQPRAEAPAGTEARAGETISSPPSVPSSAPSATITLRGFDCFIGRSFPLELDRRRTVAHRFLGLRACLAVLPRQGLARPPPPPRRGASNHASQPPPCPRHMLLAARVTRRPDVQPVTLGRVQDADNHRPVVFQKSFKAASARRASQRRRPARTPRAEGEIDAGPKSVIPRGRVGSAG